MTSDHDDGRGFSRRKILECMTWAGTGVLWTVAGGMPRSMGLIGEATAAPSSGLTFLQISDSHVGFDKPANPNAIGTLEEAINKIKSLPAKPSFVIHTGEITHLSKPSEFDDADRIIAQARLDVHYVPGEHDVLDEGEKLYRERYGRGVRTTSRAEPLRPRSSCSHTFPCGPSTSHGGGVPRTARAHSITSNVLAR